MVKIYNPNIRLSSIKTCDETLFKKFYNHFLTYRISDPFYKDECIFGQTVAKSVLEELENEAKISFFSRADHERIKAVKKIIADNAPLVCLFLLEKELYDQVEPLKPQE